MFIDSAGKPSHAGPGPHPETESDRFTLIMGGIRWFSSASAVEYKIVGTPAAAGGNTAIVAAEETWDGSFITTRSFVRNDATTQINPCSGVPNTVEWSAVDGMFGILAATGVCRNVVTKEIVGFRMIFDTGDNWTTTSEMGEFDVENAASHEFGHVAGLDHVSAPRDGCLTMYRLAGPDETQKRTLGLGDKLGTNTLYGSADVTAGSCGS